MLAGGLQDNPTRDRLLAQCDASLRSLLGKSAAIRFACLGTVDGRSFSFAADDGSRSAQRLSAMTCSLLALAESFSKEALRGRCTHATISTEFGTIVVVRVPSRTKTFALSIGADATDVMASTLRYALDTAQALGALIDRHLDDKQGASAAMGLTN